MKTGIGFGLAVTALIMAMVTGSASARGMTGEARTSFIAGSVKDCHASMQRDSNLRGIDPGVKGKICNCIAVQVANKLTIAELVNSVGATGETKKKAAAVVQAKG
jgi:hypothetical protein